jgi:hypothetical protein
MLAAAAREREHEQSRIGERIVVCNGKRLQMEGIAEVLRKLAYNICAYEPMEQKRSAETSF